MLLRKDDPWNRQLELPDVRNWRVVDTEDRSLGFVESVVIDRQNNRLEAVMTGANDRFSEDQIEVGDGVVRLRVAPQLRERPEEPAPEGSFSTYDEVFRDHFKRLYADDEDRYDALSEAYSFGRLMALDAHFFGRTYERAREDLQAFWTMERHAVPFKRAEPAVRFGYSLVREGSRMATENLAREEKQTRGRSSRGAGTSKDAGAHMAMGKPTGGSDSATANRLGAPHHDAHR